jgi:hypothetical protein
MADPKGSRFDDFVAVQKTAVDHVSTFVQGAADRTIKGDFAPKAWVESYAELWKNLAKDVADMTKIILRD